MGSAPDFRNGIDPSHSWRAQPGLEWSQFPLDTKSWLDWESGRFHGFQPFQPHSKGPEPHPEGSEFPWEWEFHGDCIRAAAIPGGNPKKEFCA